MKRWAKEGVGETASENSKGSFRNTDEHGNRAGREGGRLQHQSAPSAVVRILHFAPPHEARGNLLGQLLLPRYDWSAARPIHEM
jgi:hypothetical protein